MQNREIIFQHWQLTPYHEAWQRQKTIFDTTVSRKKEHLRTENYVIFCEHPPVYTLGKSGNAHNLLIDSAQLQAMNATFVHTDRGGDITYHGPGQIVGYPILDLDNFGIGLKQYIFLLEEIIIELLDNYNIKAERLPGAAGVWLGVDTPNPRKIGAIGVRSSHFVTMHGFALNVNTDLSCFACIHPCGFADKSVTSMQKELGKSIDLQRIIHELENIFLSKLTGK